VAFYKNSKLFLVLTVRIRFFILWRDQPTFYLVREQYLDLREQEYDQKEYVNLYTVCTVCKIHMLSI